MRDQKTSLGFPGRDFEDLAVLELGAGTGFFAKSYREALFEKHTVPVA